MPFLLRRGDLLVVNDTKVLHGRLRATRATGGAVEVFLLSPLPEAGAAGEERWEALARPSKRLSEGEEFEVGGALRVRLERRLDEGRWEVLLSGGGVPVAKALERAGEVPLPPYIRRRPGDPAAKEDAVRYQTVYARNPGSVAAPTAGLHFDEDLLGELATAGVGVARVTLSVGYGTFSPIRTEEVEAYAIHPERYRLPPETAAEINAARGRGGRVVAVGTTSVRTLETCAAEDGTVAPSDGDDAEVHLPRLPVPGGGRPRDELPPSALQPPRPGDGVRRRGRGAGGVPGSGGAGIPLLQLRRRDVHLLRSLTLRFTVEARDGGTAARAGTISTERGSLRTPAFMPVGTAATVKGVWPDQLREMGYGCILGNTYHLYLRPGHERIRGQGGLHRFMGWDRLILTDSGGFQVFSLSALRKVSDEAVTFRSHLDGSAHTLTPELAVAVQEALGSDVRMALDECVEYPAGREEVEEAVRRTTLWATRSLAARTFEGGGMFGIVQGGMFPDLRRRSVEEICALPFQGFAIGGVSVGEGKELQRETVAGTAPMLPASMPRYLMGVGTPADILFAIARGVDLFDCVLPTRNARNGMMFTSAGHGIDQAGPVRGRSPFRRTSGATAPRAAASPARTCATSTSSGRCWGRWR